MPGGAVAALWLISLLSACGTSGGTGAIVPQGNGQFTGGVQWSPDATALADGATASVDGGAGSAADGGGDGAATDTGNGGVGDSGANDSGANDSGANDSGANDSDGSSGDAVDTGKDAPSLSLLDLDADGFSPFDGDCDDKDKTIFPGAGELCDDKDNDCNGKVDDRDKDLDGFSVCPGALQDCNDGDSKIFPGAPVDCKNGKDNNCDGVIDGAASGDNDGDGFDACSDCDDTDKTIYPGAPASCDNAKDNDCDGLVDAVIDADKDGFAACVDCDDNDATVWPLAPEVCNGKDNDCSGVIDDLDMDGDGYSACSQDCDDTDININPGAGRNCKNGKDNDCNGKLDSLEDGDGDGFVGCDDCDDADAGQNPNAWEFPADLIDNDCDGQTDEAPISCDVGNLADGNANDYVTAIDICPPPKAQTVKSSAFPTLASATARAIKTVYGPKNLPREGNHMVVLSTGAAAAEGMAGYKVPQNGTSFTNSAPYPQVNCKKSGEVYDYTEWAIQLQVPGNVNGFSFEFNFMSAEYPEWVGTQFNDKFLAVLDSKKFKGNVSFDANGNCISINNAFFTVCTGCKQGDGELAGTGYQGGIGGGTGWLTTTSPVEPGETITLRFIVFDEGDHIYDSVVLLDNFRWEVLGSGTGGPSTVRPGG